MKWGFKMKGYLKLEDGSVFEGNIISKKFQGFGEVVFNTGMTGYQEIITDPSYAGQIVVMTYPLIGNYGINKYDFQSEKPHIRGYVVREYCDSPSNFLSDSSLLEYLDKNGIPVLAGVDTRELTKKLRSNGTMRGIITDDANASVPNFSGDLLKEVSTKKAYHIQGEGPKMAFIDLGTKKNILKMLNQVGFDIYVFPYDVSCEDVMAIEPEAIFFSNGPGDPKDAVNAIELAKFFIGKIPVLGICLGHQIIALAMGCNTVKMKFGHRGSNQPVKDLLTGKSYVTSQNHGYAVEESSINRENIIVTHINLNDGTVEGIRHKYLPVFSVQYHPEASPGPHDSMYLFDKFMDITCVYRRRSYLAEI
ncbi:glutamine-hydrolyzing carbamoyl-phosphate synthase small subunit [Thermoanaerobacterium thermosaccharolyticum]|uniref:glutamine-hydrolyzing carbamoyl-phosphate synthase small subunit n=1 Tax=Thermoanaerobacterium thermosaccharolyticum TaxID=1517 RepID=UPI003DA7F59C